MRPLPTEAELAIREAITNELKKIGHSVYFPERDKHDKPDLLFEVNGVIIACECTQIPPKYIFEHEFKADRWDGFDLFSATYPNEPHYWAEEAIKKKNSLIESYIKNTNCSQVWLVLHSPAKNTQSFLKYHPTWIRHAILVGSNQFQHHFNKILFWTPQQGIHQVEKKPISEIPTLSFNFSRGHPTLCVNRAKITTSATKNSAESPNIIFHEFSTRKSKIIEPMDDNFRKHPPAISAAKYKLEGKVWHNKGEVKISVLFEGSDKEISLKPIHFNKIQPGMEFCFHFLHEFPCP